MKGIKDSGLNIGIVNTAERDSPPDAPYFALQMRGGDRPDSLVFAAGVCSEGEDIDELEMRRYAVSLLYEFFRKRGRKLEVADYNRMLKRIFSHMHQHISKKWSEQGLGLDMAVVIASATTAYCARSGNGGLFIYHDENARSVFSEEGDVDSLLGTGSEEAIEMAEVKIQPGDIAVLCNPAISQVIGTRDVTLILRRASDPPKASLFLSAIAERKGAENPMAALIWEVPNYQGAAILTEETPPPKQPESAELVPGEEESGEGTAEQAKKQWLSKWRRRKE